MSVGRRLVAMFASVLLTFADTTAAFAYLIQGVQVGDQQVPLKWTRSPVRYFVNGQGAQGVTTTDLQAAVGRAFATWQSVPTASIAYQFAGATSALPLQEDGQSTIGFASRPDLDRVLASTDVLFDEATGEIVEADIFFNTTFQWSVAAGGEAGRFDLESIAVHEIGHFNGLGHSALGETEVTANGRRVIAAEAVMFPIAFPSGNIAGRMLKADDVAGISELYPENGFATAAGSLSGRVTRSGVGEFGAHVIAFNPATGALVAGFSLDSQGRFVIGGLSPGPYVLRVEPLDDAAVDSFFELSDRVDLDFRVTFASRLIVVPRGGDSGSVEVAVVGK
jgi:hypothetical protein